MVWHDIPEHLVRESERTAKAQVKQLEAIFDAITDAILVYDREGYMIQTNTAARELIARVFSSDDVVGEANHQRFTQLSMTDAQGQPFSLKR